MSYKKAVTFIICTVLALASGCGSASAEGSVESMKKDDKPATQAGFPLGDAELKKILTPRQYRVTRQKGTEPPFFNKYWNNKKSGIYVDIITGEPLFSSLDKFDSGTGWPSFTRPIEPERVVEAEDRSHGMVRIEVKARISGSHLGHVFNDGPAPGGLRYCVNSAALRFVPAEDLEKEGYARYLSLFESSLRKPGLTH